VSPVQIWASLPISNPQRPNGFWGFLVSAGALDEVAHVAPMTCIELCLVSIWSPSLTFLLQSRCDLSARNETMVQKVDSVLLSNEEKILLIDEVVSTAVASWQIYVEGDKEFSGWPDERQNSPEYRGYHTIKNLLSHSLMGACYALVETGRRSYSMHHAVKDQDLIVTQTAKTEFQNCCNFRGKIATYRNNVTAHVNATRTQSDWAQIAGIKNQDISDYLLSAHNFVEELGRANLSNDFVPSSRVRFKRDFRAFCRVMAGM
jgi:hypothetical protein